MIIKYETFENSEQFEEFQKQNPINVINVMPIPREIIEGNNRQNLIISVFVTYIEKTEKK